MSAQTIADRLRSLQVQIDQSIEDVNTLEDTDLNFDIVTRLLATRREIRDALIIAEGAIEIEQIAA